MARVCCARRPLGRSVARRPSRRSTTGRSTARSLPAGPPGTDHRCGHPRHPRHQDTGYAAVDVATPVGTPVYAASGGWITRSYDIAGPLPSDTYHNAMAGLHGSFGRVMYLKTDLGPEVLYAHLSQRGMSRRDDGAWRAAGSGCPARPATPPARTCTSVTLDGNPMEFFPPAPRRDGTRPDCLDFMAATGSKSGARSFLILKDRYPTSLSTGRPC